MKKEKFLSISSKEFKNNKRESHKFKIKSVGVV